MNTSRTQLSEREKELVDLVMSECETTGDIQEKLKRLFAGTIEQMLEAGLVPASVFIECRKQTREALVLESVLFRLFDSP